MRITKRKVNHVITAAIGEDVVPVGEMLFGKKDVSEFVLAKELDLDINSVRNMLYRLHNENLVMFTKKKDYTKGWYVYYWTLNSKRIQEIEQALKDNRIKFLQRRLEREKGHLFYICCNKCARFDFEKATDFEFKCPECSSILVEDDNTRTIVQLETELEKLESKV